MTDAEFTPVKDLDDLDAVFDRSATEPVVLFLHAPHCPIGAMAYFQMRHLGQPAALINVAKQRDLTREVERRTGVRHESPQVLVLRNGEVVWDASHDDITADMVESGLRSAA